jgi:hypothetical protein
MVWQIAWGCALLVAMLWDLISLKLALTLILTGHGASGVPVLSWLVYVACLGYGRVPFGLSKPQAIVAFMGLTVFHLCCQIAIPLVCRRLANRRTDHR